MKKLLNFLPNPLLHIKSTTLKTDDNNSLILYFSKNINFFPFTRGIEQNTKSYHIIAIKSTNHKPKIVSTAKTKNKS
jgi:hypothetical protein